MAIAKKPKSPITDATEKKASEFITAADKEAKESKKNRTPILIRLPPTMLERLDAAADGCGLARSAWITLAVDEKLKREV